MDKQYLAGLLNKYLKGELSPEERQFLDSYYNLFQQEPDVLDNLNAEEKELLRNSMKNAVRDNISKHEMSVGQIRRIYSRLPGLAAAAVIAGILVLGLFYLIDKKAPEASVNADVAVSHIRQNRVIFLPDGSTVVLSAGSKLNYPSSFDGMEAREVFLEGQAFFDIRHNASRPFIVRTGKLKTTVLGTSFNIRAVPDEASITVTVKQGKVMVSDQENKTLGIITPNQQITYNKKKVSSELNTVDNDNYLNWADQDLFVDNVTISEAAKLLEERYGVNIRITDSSISSQRFTATFSKDESFEQSIKSVCIFNGLNYRYNGKKDTVMIGSDR